MSEIKLYRYFFPSKDEDGEVTPGLITLDPMCNNKNELFEMTRSSDLPFINDIQSADQMDEEMIGEVEVYLQKEQLISFLNQTNDSYVDKYGFEREIYQGKDQIYSYTFYIIDDDWSKLTEGMGLFLDGDYKEYPFDVTEEEMASDYSLPEDVRIAAEKIYFMSLSILNKENNVEDYLLQEPEDMEKE